MWLPRPKQVIVNRFEIISRLGEGGDGFVLKAFDRERKEYVAAKVAPVDTRLKLIEEADIHRRLFTNRDIDSSDHVWNGADQNANDRACFPELIWEGAYKSTYILIWQLLGPNLDELRHTCGGRLTLNTVKKIGYQMVERLRTIHSNDMMYTDVCPTKFMIGGTEYNKSILFLNDLGQCRKIGEINEMKRSLWCSIRRHTIDHSEPRDDLESMFYVLFYLLDGTLPWFDWTDETSIINSKHDFGPRRAAEIGLQEAWWFVQNLKVTESRVLNYAPLTDAFLLDEDEPFDWE